MNKKEYDRLRYLEKTDEIKSKTSEYKKANIDKQSKYAYAYTLKKYGMTFDDYNKMFEEQNGCCASCGDHQILFTKRLVVDHNHETGKVRALLCSNCNTALGLLKENEERILSLLEYNRKHK
jgi:hypothetical protein